MSEKDPTQNVILGQMEEERLGLEELCTPPKETPPETGTGEPELFFGEQTGQAYCLYCGYGGCPGHTWAEIDAAARRRQGDANS